MACHLRHLKQSRQYPNFSVVYYIFVSLLKSDEVDILRYVYFSGDLIKIKIQLLKLHWMLPYKRRINPEKSGMGEICIFYKQNK